MANSSPKKMTYPVIGLIALLGLAGAGYLLFTRDQKVSSPQTNVTTEQPTSSEVPKKKTDPTPPIQPPPPTDQKQMPPRLSIEKGSPPPPQEKPSDTPPPKKSPPPTRQEKMPPRLSIEKGSPPPTQEKPSDTPPPKKSSPPPSRKKNSPSVGQPKKDKLLARLYASLKKLEEEGDPKGELPQQLWSLARLEKNKGHVKEALQLYEKLLPYYLVKPLEYLDKIREVFQNLSLLYFEVEAYDKPVELYVNLKKNLMPQLPPKSPYWRDFTFLGARCFYEKGDFEEAWKAYKAGFQYYEASKAENPLPKERLADQYFFQGGAAYALDKIKEARESWQKVLLLYQEAWGEESLPVATIYINLALTYSQGSDVDEDEAKKYADKAIAVAQKIFSKTPWKVARFYLKASLCFSKLDNYHKEKNYLKQAAEAIQGEEAQDPQTAFEIHHKTFLLAQKYDEYEKAHQAIDQAIDVAEEYVPASSQELATAYNHKAKLYRDQKEKKDYEAALAYWEKSLEISKALVEKGVVSVAVIAAMRQDMGEVYELKREVPKAIESFKAAITFWQQAEDQQKAASKIKALRKKIKALEKTKKRKGKKKKRKKKKK